ncbi:MAG: ferrochelatase [Myxococcota bacterium]
MPPRRTGVLLINLGTPDACTTPAVRRYLREFLMDPRVLDINPVARWLLVNLIIAPFRSPKSAHAYQQVWTERGSPLLTAGQDLSAAVQVALGDGYDVELGMRYQNPSIEAALQRLDPDTLDRLIVLPLFPQYSSAATGSAIQELFDVLGARWNVPSVQVISDFYDHPGFIQAQAAVAQEELANFGAEKVLFSYHGLPERHVQKSWKPGFTECSLKGPCPAMQPGNRYCYRAQCYATTRALQTALGLDDDTVEVSFQSRLGRTPWIQPYTDEVMPKLAAQGVKRLAVMCPAFTADCLETLEEIGIRAREDWKAAGGESLLLLPCVNAAPDWVDAVAQMVRDA